MSVNRDRHRPNAGPGIADGPPPLPLGSWGGFGGPTGHRRQRRGAREAASGFLEGERGDGARAAPSFNKEIDMNKLHLRTGRGGTSGADVYRTMISLTGTTGYAYGTSAVTA